MSNPFATFRKNQKYWMAAMVLLAILAFVIYPVFDYASRAIGGSSDAGQVVVRWNGGKITVGDLRNSVQKHASLVRFMGRLAEEVIEGGGQPQVPGFAYNPQTKQILGLGIQSSSNELDVCRTRILATQAEKLGIEFSDDTIDEFIMEFCDDRVATGRIEELLAETTGGRLNSFDVREMLKEELSAMVVGQIARSGLYAQSPGKTFRDFMKLNQTAKVEAFPILVDDYISQVTTDPTEAELQAIYDIGMSQPANANSAEPGFARRYQANVEYIQASLDKWTEREKAKLTEEALKAEYDRRVELGQLKVPVESAEEETSAGETTGETTGSAEDQAAAEAAPNDDAPGANAADETSGDEAAGGESTNSEPPANSESDTTETSGDAPAAGDQSGRMTERSSGRLVAFVQSEDTQAAGEPIPAETTPAETTPVERPPRPGGYDQPSTTADGTADATAPSAASATDGTATVPATEGPSVDAVDSEPKFRTQTFEEARDKVAESLARDAAVRSLDEALTEIFRNTMQPYYGTYRQYAAFQSAELQPEEGESGEPPVRPNLKQLAEKYDLVYGTTEMIDGVALAQIPIGLSMIPTDREAGLGGSVANMVMNPNFEIFRPLQSSYMDQAELMAGGTPEFLQYLLWKTDERSAYVPEMSEVRDEVVDVWKRQKARQLAEAAAAEIAKNVGGADPWSQALDRRQVGLLVTTEPFTWMMRYGEYNMTSNVPLLDAVGGEFMQRVFSTPAGQVVVAPNTAKSVYYVCRVVEFSPGQEDLQQRFNADPLKSGPFGIAREESDRLVVDWYQNLELDLGVDWRMNLGQFTN